MEPIASTDNSLVKLARSLHEAKGRARHAAFLVEGLRLLEAAADCSAPRIVLHTIDFQRTSKRAAMLLERLDRNGTAVRAVTEKVMAHVSDTVTPQGIVAVVSLPEAATRAADSTLDLVLDEIQDPGNAGALLRSAAAGGVGRVLCSAGTVDPYSPKVVRAAAGAHFHVEISWVAWDALGAGRQVVLADARAKQPYWEVDWRRPSTLVVGNEARGTSADAQSVATHRVSIPMADGVESLNAAVAGSIILYEALRQRTASGVIA